MINNIDIINNMYQMLVPAEYTDKFYNPTKYPVIYGYNICTSYRNGGKTTNGLLWGMCANKVEGSHISYIRTDNTMTTESKVSTLFDSINNTVLDDGRNYIEHIYDDKYNRVYYLPRRKVFVLGREDMNVQDLKKAEVLCYVHDVGSSDKYRSGFADNKLDIIVYDEMIDERVTNKSFIQLMHIISTFCRTRYKSVIFMFCNMSTGKPVIMQKMGIYTKVLAQDIPFKIYTTELGTKIAVEILEVSESFSIDREKMNITFFGFKEEGMEIIRGSSIVHDIYREIEDTDELSDTGISVYTCGAMLRVYKLHRDGWQVMYAVKQIPLISEYRLCLTDDKVYAYEHPYAYTSAGKDKGNMAIELIKAVRRNDICYDMYMSMVYLNGFLDNYKIPELL